MGMKRILRQTGDETEIDFTVLFDRAWHLHEIRLHIDIAPGTADILNGWIVSAASQGGSPSTFQEYDTTLVSEDMAAETDWHWQPDAPVYFGPGDAFHIDWDNSAEREWGLEVVIDTL